MVWMVTPLPVVTMPTMRSPGSGWQQPAKCIAMPGIRPRIGMAWLPFGGLGALAVERHHLVRRGLGTRAGEDRVHHLAGAEQALADLRQRSSASSALNFFSTPSSDLSAYS